MTKRLWMIVAAAMLVLASIPASATMWKWSQTASSNSNADSTINWAEGQSPGSVNNSARAVMAAIAKFRDDLGGVSTSNGQLEVGGTASAYTLTTNQSLTSLTNGFTVTFKVGSGLTNDEGATLAVDGLTAKNISSVAGSDLEEGVLVAGSLYTVTYHQPDDEWILHGFYKGSADNVPAGVIHDYAGSSAPDGYLLAFGQDVSRTTYADLFTAIGTTYGAGDGSTTFGIPDLRGRVVAGQDDMGGASANRLTDQSGGLDGDTLGDTGGAETHTLTLNEIPAHDHNFSDPGHDHDYIDDGTGNNLNDGAQDNAAANTQANRTTDSSTTGITLDSQGGDAAHNNVQPTIVLNKIIKF